LADRIQQYSEIRFCLLCGEIMAESADLQKLYSASLDCDLVIREGWFSDVGV